MRTDSSAKQKSIGLLADGWGSTPSQTLSLCSRPVRHPSCEWTHCAHSVHLPPLIMCEEGKSSLSEQPCTSSLLKLRGYCKLETSFFFSFSFYWNLHRNVAIWLHCARQEAIVALVSSDCDADKANVGIWLSQGIKHNLSMQILQSLKTHAKYQLFYN